MNMAVVNKTLEMLREKHIKLVCERPFGWKILSKVLQYQIDKYEERLQDGQDKNS